MPKLIELQDGQQPPSDIDMILVERTPSGGALATGSIQSGEGEVSYVTLGPGDWDDVMAEARGWAEFHGDLPIYVKTCH